MRRPCVVFKNPIPFKERLEQGERASFSLEYTASNDLGIMLPADTVALSFGVHFGLKYEVFTGSDTKSGGFVMVWTGGRVEGWT